MLKVTVRGLKNLQKDLKVESQRQIRALTTAIKVEGFRLRKELVKEIKKGAPGGQRFAPLTWVARAWHQGKGNWRANKPLAALTKGIFVHFSKASMAVEVGWVGPRSSVTMRRLAKQHQEGFTGPLGSGKYSGDFKRGFFASKAARMSNRSQGRKYLFIRKSTTSFRTPARPIMDPFWDKHEKEAWPNIKRNFKLKMQGKRI